MLLQRHGVIVPPLEYATMGPELDKCNFKYLAQASGSDLNIQKYSKM